MRVTARGPAEVDFERTGSAEQGALITTAGSYLVCATLGARLLAGAPLFAARHQKQTTGQDDMQRANRSADVVKHDVQWPCSVMCTC